MGAPLPVADPAPVDGALPASVAVDAASRDFGVYLHVPFCRVRCGYCDFNTYTADELRGAKRSDYAAQAITEIDLAERVLADAALPARAASTVFFGGGTPTMLGSEDLIAMFDAVRRTWGVDAGAEVTTEANPDSVDADYLARLAEAGFTRVSFGVQSAVPRVLATLERTHDPERVPVVVHWARQAGLDVSVDLIYGTPGETIADWSATLDYALALDPDHISAYALIVEEGTKLARQIRRGEVAGLDDDLQADLYELADQTMSDAGFRWYEVSNWSRDARHRSRHNLAYWTGQDWWGIGPGAHSHIGGIRWWNVKHPAAYADRLAAGVSPAVGRETLDAGTRLTERVLLGSRLAEGIRIPSLPAPARTAVAGLIADDLVDGPAAIRGTLVLTLRGRLLADAVVRRLLD